MKLSVIRLAVVHNKWIYRGEKLTMIIVDTQVDGNQFFAFYDNNKEVK